jgi:hypothetical protein
VAAGAGIARLYGLAGSGVFLFFQFSFDYVSWMQFHLAPFFMRESQKSFSQLTAICPAAKYIDNIECFDVHYRR